MHSPKRVVAMFDEISKDAEVLSDSKVGWVNRRDAADHLGEAAKRALTALQSHRQEPDVDVRMAVEKAIQHGAGGLTGVTPAAAKHGYALQDLANACSKPGERSVRAHGEGYEIEVSLKTGRRQKVYLMPHSRKDGVRLVRVYTYCGRPKPESLKWALQTNTKLTHGALALLGDGDEERLVLVDSYLMDEATPETIKRSVKESAFYGDWIESKLTGMDEL
jgi:hypothetical protein